MTPGGTIDMTTDTGETIQVTNDLTKKELEIIQSGGLLNAVRNSAS